MLISPFETELLDELLLAGYPPELIDFQIQRNFHYFLACGFDEIRAAAMPERSNFWENDLRDDLKLDILNTPVSKLLCDSYVFQRMSRLRFRHQASGAWLKLGFTSPITSGNRRFSVSDRFSYVFVDEDSTGAITISVHPEELLESLLKGEESNTSRCSLLLLPHLFDGMNMTKRVAVSDHIRNVFDTLQTGQTELRNIHWRDLEELIAELFREKGFHVEITPATKDGGRDLLIRGEFLPGEPNVIAVEVKQKDVVGLADLRNALRANRHFPALLFATSGRFTAGVLKESRESDTALRLILKDGVGLMQMISAYLSARHEE